MSAERRHHDTEELIRDTERVREQLVDLSTRLDEYLAALQREIKNLEAKGRGHA